jgi:hypothetical protein
MGVYKFKLLIWFSLVLIALAVAAIDVMMWKVNLLNPQNEPAVTNIVFNDVWYKISILIFSIPAIFMLYVTKKKINFVLVIAAGLILIFFGVEDIFYFAIRGLVIPNELYSASQLSASSFTKIGFINYMPNDLYWLNGSLISLFGIPVTPFILFKSAAFALAISLVLVLI